MSATPAEILYDAETEILANIARHLRAGNTASADWKIDRLKKLGILNKETAEIIRKYRDSVRNGAASAVNQAAMEALIKGEATFARAARAGATMKDVLPLEADPAIRATIETWASTAKTQTDLAMATMLEKSGEVYVDILNRVTAQVVTGAQSGREALATAVKEWAGKGIPSIVDKAGRQWTTEAYANMVIRTNTRRVTTETTFQRAQEYGADLVEVSAHAGARPGCAPYQGKIYSISGTSDKYPALASTSYGEPDGLFGINCGHVQYPFFEGISRQTYAPTQDAEENAEQYKESQRQRYLERSIRAAKREVSTLQALGDLGKNELSKAKRTLADRQGAMRDFIQETGRTRQRGREQVYDTGEPLKVSPGSMGRGPKIRTTRNPPKARPQPPKQPDLPVQQPAPAKPAPATAPAAAQLPAKPPQTPAPPVNKKAWETLEKYTPQATAAAAAEWAVKNDLASIADYGKVTKEAANIVNEEIFTAYKKYPRLRDKMDHIGSVQRITDIYIAQRSAELKRQGGTPEYIKSILAKEVPKINNSTMASSYRGDLQAIVLNEYHFRDNALVNNAIRSSASQGWLPKGTGSIKSIIDHEIGHRIDNLFENPYDGTRLSDAPEFRAIITSRAREEDKSVEGFLYDNLSGYASGFYSKYGRFSEALAEAWSEYTNSPQPRPLAKAIGDFIDQKYKETFNAQN